MDAVNALLIRALLQYYLFDGDTFKIECPTGTGNLMNLFEAAREISNRLTRIFGRDQSGRRPVYGGTEKFQTDPHWELTSRYTNLPRRQRHRPRRKPPDRLDWSRPQADRPLRAA